MVPRHAVRGVFTVLERLVTALLYPVCRLLVRPGRGGRVPILMYHQIGRPLPGPGPGGGAVSPERFALQMRVLSAAGYEVISLGELVRRLEERTLRSRTKRAVVTFDDGLRGQMAGACPVLERHGFPATFFLIAGALGTDRLLPHLAAAAGGGVTMPDEWLQLSWEEARQLRDRAFEIGSHSMSHRSLGRLEPADIEREARGSREVLERRLGVPVELFAYPFGSRAYGDFGPGTAGLLRRAGYRGACTTVVGTNGRGADLLALKRIPVEQGDGPFRLRCKLAGAYDWVGPVKSLWQRLVTREEQVDAPAPWRAAGGPA
ncbi:MAG: polysaccharide deacetylase family protein [Candidatus Polarisedimenticolia bacterium]